MNTSQTPGHISSGHNVMGNTTLYMTLIVSTLLVLAFILLEYYFRHGRNPFNRVGYALFISVMPAVAALIVLKLTTFFESWRGAAGVYIAFLVLVSMIQAYGR